MRMTGTGGEGMSGKGIGTIALVLGVLLFLVSAAADSVGIGGHPGMGWKQVLGLAGGVALAAFGMVKLRR